MLRIVMILFSFGIATSSGCSKSANKSSQIERCSSEWLEFVEETLTTGDGQGHGPDIGSLEWRSVVEFKLGVRGDSSVPPAGSNQWCNYINERILEYGS